VLTFSGKGILLDIEGTTSSVRFVVDVLFPFARAHLEAFLRAHWDDAEVRKACEQIARDAGGKSLADWTGNAGEEAARGKVIAEVHRLMDGDVKATGLKELQGLIWREGYNSGELRSHVYEDVPAALQAWTTAGKDVRIYSSGSVTAQKLFFAHTDRGDLTGHFRGHYDTTTGPKKESASYAAIAADMKLPPAEVLFCSDVVAELDAAAAAGMVTALLVRPGNAPAGNPNAHASVTSFAQIRVPGSRRTS
jgi:enolase-phosphatase E1